MAIETQADAGTDPDAVRSARRIRTTAIVLAWMLAAGWLALPALRGVFVLMNNAAEIQYPVAADIPALEPQAVFGGLTYLVLGGLTLALTVTVRSLQVRPSRVALTGTIAGATAGIALVVTGFEVRTLYSWITANLAEAAPDHDAQAAAMWMSNSSLGAALLAIAGIAVWAVCATVDGGAIGRGWGWTASAVAVVAAVVAWAFVLPAAQSFYGPFFALVAVGFWRRARRMRETSADE